MSRKCNWLDQRVPLALGFSRGYANPIIIPESVRFDEEPVAVEKYAVSNGIDFSGPLSGRRRSVQKNSLKRPALQQLTTALFSSKFRRNNCWFETIEARTSELLVNRLITAQFPKDCYAPFLVYLELE